MTNHLDKNVIVVYSKMPTDRDHLRSHLSKSWETIVCFEKEGICFDNLKSIQPDVIVAQTDSQDTAWRFIFALNALDLSSSLLIASDLIENADFESNGCDVFVQCIPNRIIHNGINGRIKSILFNNSANKGIDLPMIVGQSDEIRNIRRMLPCLSQSTDSILITGERGTGKELFARCVAIFGGTQNAIVKFNCKDFSAETVRRFRAAEQTLTMRGRPHVTVLLEGVHLLNEKSQAELLLLIDQPDKWMLQQNGSVTSGGASIRFIATSEKNLDDLVKQGAYRKDLYYRLNVIPIIMPSLRNRPGDVPMLMDYLIIQACAQQNKSVFMLSDKVKESLSLYKWPGNIDELKNMMMRIVGSGDETSVYINDKIPKPKVNPRQQLFRKIDEQALPGIFEIQHYMQALNTLSLKHICDEFVSRTEKRLMQKALESTNWNRKKAAELLNISYKSMLNKIKMYEIS